MAVLRAKLRGRQGGGGGADVAEACAIVQSWPLALARAAAEGAGLDLRLPRWGSRRRSLAELVEDLPERPLATLVDRPGGGLGAFVLSADLAAAMVETQTLGRLGAQPAPLRPPTPVDAALAADVIDRTLSRLEAAAALEPEGAWAAGYRYATFLAAPHTLPRLLEDQPYRCFWAEVDCGPPGRRGQALLALPAGATARAAAGPGVATEAADLVFAAALRAEVEAAPVLLDAVIARVAVPLSQVMALAPGEVLRLPGAAVDRVDLLAPGGVRVAGGKLGQTRGLRALRLDGAASAVSRGDATLAPGLASAEEALRRAG
jgi:flagellar motor switch protein FliM